MHRFCLLFLLIVSQPGYTDSKAGLSQKKCAAISNNMRVLQSRLREGHSARQGRDWKRRMRELQMQRYRGCR